ncbi:hypothetical protein TrST_g1711 [Triparma strigata]|uniref:Uncharacterized protein n=1 Tax=Triparma strigata TaxID=1606541 RepID=A0A9W7BNG6_9STRA|nr:hypothetical protein TrST_g1711 [Triparma strigata]
MSSDEANGEDGLPLPQKLDPGTKQIVDIRLEIARRQAGAERKCEEGNNFFDIGNFEEALGAYNAALQMAPNHLESRGNRANVKIALGDYAGCIDDTNKVVDLSLRRGVGIGAGLGSDQERFNLSIIYYTQAEAYFNLKSYYESLRDVDNSLALRPDFVEALCCRGATHNALGNFTVALSDLDSCLKLRANYAMALRQRGICLCCLKKFAASARDLRKAVKMDANDEAAVKWLDKATRELKLEEDAADLIASGLILESSAEVASITEAGKKKKKKRKKKKKVAKRTEVEVEDVELEAEPKEEEVRTPAPEENGEEVEEEEEEAKILREETYDSYDNFSFNFLHDKNAMQANRADNWENDSVSSASTGVNKSLEHDLFSIEVAAMVDTVLAVGTASVLGRQQVSEQMCLAVALQMQRQTKIGLLRALREQYIEDNMRNVFQQIQVEALVDTAIAVGTASVLGKLSGKKEVVSEQMVLAAANQMENQVKNGLIIMKERLILDNVRHVFKNVPAQVVATGRRFSWGSAAQLGLGPGSTGQQQLDSVRKKVREAERDLEVDEM